MITVSYLMSTADLQYLSQLARIDSELSSIAQVCGLGSIVRRTVGSDFDLKLVCKDKYDDNSGCGSSTGSDDAEH